MLKAAFAALALGAVVLGGCAGDPYGYGPGPRENTGTLVGALAGGLIGSQFGGSAGAQVGAAVAGAAIGGLIGNRIGAAMDDEDRRRAYAAEMTAMEAEGAGGPIEWRNPNSGHYGMIVPGPVRVARGTRCRNYTHTIYIRGQPEVARGVACRNPDGTWTPV
ncbi:MAG: glycine zipper 2TM domain-containing protein [Rhizobiales bacterium]|nr:glycine zipper 2TM domain-containing protein [Hyphomicrobiales bacterium]